jgi:hypothetical protein
MEVCSLGCVARTSMLFAVSLTESECVEDPCTKLEPTVCAWLQFNAGCYDDLPCQLRRQFVGVIMDPQCRGSRR